MKSEVLRVTHELQAMKDKIKENSEKIKVNKTLPYLVSNVIEVCVYVEGKRGSQQGLGTAWGGATRERVGGGIEAKLHVRATPPEALSWGRQGPAKAWEVSRVSFSVGYVSSGVDEPCAEEQHLHRDQSLGLAGAPRLVGSGLLEEGGRDGQPCRY